MATTGNYVTRERIDAGVILDLRVNGLTAVQIYGLVLRALLQNKHDQERGLPELTKLALSSDGLKALERAVAENNAMVKSHVGYVGKRLMPLTFMGLRIEL